MRQLAAVLLLLCAVRVLADEPPAQKKEAWEWTLAERVAKRSDAQDNMARIRRAVAAGKLDPRNDDSFIVVTDDNPELALPTELMDTLTAAYSLRDEVKQRARRKWAGAEKYLGPDYWTRLHDVAGIFFDTDRRRERLQKELDSMPPDQREGTLREWQKANDSLCALRAMALIAARATFGHEKFDRFLYEVVAPHDIYSGSPMDLDTAQWLERGCPNE